MAKVYYVVENAPDYSQVNFYKTEKEALEFGLSQIPNFEMGEEPMNDEENDGEEWFHGAELTFDKGILYTVADGEVEVEAIDEDAAREKCLENEDAVAIFFDGFTKGMYGYQGRDADGKGYKWDWDGFDINESNTSSIKHKIKHVQLFEQFINEKKSDGTISDDEDEREDDLMANVEVAIDDLISLIKKEANEIGGSFRSPGIESRVGKLLKEKLAKAKLIR